MFIYIDQMTYNSEKISGKIASSLKSAAHYSVEQQKGINFHVLDWLSDLEKLTAFYENPDEFSDEEVENILMNFLIHAPNHIAAASKLMTDVSVSDVFEVGAIETPSMNSPK